MTFGPGSLVADRFELIREIGGHELGRVWIARDHSTHFGNFERWLAAQSGSPAEEA